MSITLDTLAAAIQQVPYGKPPDAKAIPWVDVAPYAKSYFRRQVAGVLEALQEPTPEMLNAGFEADDGLSAQWRAMVTHLRLVVEAQIAAEEQAAEEEAAL